MSGDLYLVRHGQTMFNEKRVIQGWCDAPLTSEGEEQAERIGRYFAREGIAFDHAYTSTLTRTQQTIERIVDMPYERVEGERVDLMPPFPWGNFYVPFGGEGQMAVRARVSDALARIMEQPGHGRVLVVSHGSACREFLTKWVPDGGFGCGSVMHFTFDKGAFELVEILEQDKLRDLLRE